MDSCPTCTIALTFAQNSEMFVTGLAEALNPSMLVIFAAVTGLWVSISGLKIVMGKLDLISFGHELFFVILAGGLLAGQSGVVTQVYKTGINTISGASSLVMDAARNTGGDSSVPLKGEDNNTTLFKLTSPNAASKVIQTYKTENDKEVGDEYLGIVRLLYATENGFLAVMDMGKEIYMSFSLGNLTGPLAGLLIMLVWLILILVYLSQVLVTLFRVMVLSGMSPFLLLAVGFGWARGMVWASLKALMAAGMVLYGATIAIGFCLFSVSVIDMSKVDGISMGTFFTSAGFTAVLVGYMGIIFVTEATAIANSIAQSQFTNTAAAAIVGGTMGAAFGLANKVKPFLPPAAQAAMKFTDKLEGGASNWSDAMQASRNNPNMMGDAKSSFFGDLRNVSSMGDMGKYMDALRRGGVDRG